MVARWRAMGTYTDRQLDTLRASLADGRVASVSPIRRTITVLEEVLDAPVERWPLLDPLGGLDELEGWSAEQQDALRDRAALRRSTRRSGRRSSGSTTHWCWRSSPRHAPTASRACVP